MTDNTDYKNTQMSDEELVAQYMNMQLQTLPDNGFSEQVLRQLPDNTAKTNRIWMIICIAIGIVFFICVDGFSILNAVMHDMLCNLKEHVMAANISIIELPLLILSGAALMALFAFSNMDVGHKKRQTT